MAEAMKRDSGLLREAAAGRSGPMIEAIRQEARVRADPNLRADRFVERWPQLSQDRDRLSRAGDMAGRKTLGQEVARSEEHTSELQSLMRNSNAVFCLKKQRTRTTSQ